MFSTRSSSLTTVAIATLAIVPAGIALYLHRGDPPAPDEPFAAIVTAAPAPRAPMSLTASDGSGLALTALEASAVIEGPLAFTELHLDFRNPEARVREGTFAIALPPGAAVSRFAMLRDGRWNEAEVVAKQHARAVYSDLLHARRDPALLEAGTGNQFTARVFPIPAHGEVRLVISYSQDLGGDYVLPLRGLPAVDRVTVRIDRHDGGPPEALARSSWTPDRDVVVRPYAETFALRSGELIAALVEVPRGPAADLDDITLLVDTSASRARGYAAYAGQVTELVSALRARGAEHLRVVAFDQTAVDIFDGDASDYREHGAPGLLARGAAGASNLGAALAWVGARHPRGRLVIVGDGVVTAGPDRAELAKAVRGLGVARVDFALAGAVKDQAAAEALARPSGGDAFDLDVDVARVADALAHDAHPVAVDVPGATWVSARTIRGRAVVYARRPRVGAQITLRVDGADVVLPVQDASAPLLARAVAGVEVAELEARLAGMADADPGRGAVRAEITKRALAARLVSSQTSMLVLETEYDYRSYGIDRHALADILVVHDGAVGVMQRPPGMWMTREEAIEQARSAGIRGFRGAGMPVMTSTADISAGFDDTSISGALASRREAIAQARDAGILGALREPGGTAMVLAEEAPPVDDRARPPSATDRFAKVRRLLATSSADALAEAQRWLREDPEDVLALLAFGEVLEARGDADDAARVYGSIIDLHPARAEMRRLAGERLEHVGTAAARALAIDTYRRAAADRPDQPSGRRLLAYAQLRGGDYAGAWETIAAARAQRYQDGLYRGVSRILDEDAGLIAAAWIAHGGHPDLAGVAVPAEASTRFVLSWETDANDVDLHVRDARGNHAYFGAMKLATGGELYADVTTGYGPECFAIRGEPTAGPYQIDVHYFAQGMMGYGLGALQVIRHDGRGNLSFEDRPFALLADRSELSLGEVR